MCPTTCSYPNTTKKDIVFLNILQRTRLYSGQDKSMSTTRPVFLYVVAEGIFSSQTIDIWSDDVNGKLLKVVMFHNFIF